MIKEHQGNYSLRLALVMKRILDASDRPLNTGVLTAQVMIQNGVRLTTYQRQLLRRNIIRIGTGIGRAPVGIGSYSTQIHDLPLYPTHARSAMSKSIPSILIGLAPKLL